MSLLGQQQPYQPFTKDSAKEKLVAANIDQRYELDVKSLSGNYKKEVAALYKERSNR